jgi:L,D-peptidoglycan transpeptidase YkuD (ErfK/YbiS/YcfS/YnhG family)
MKYPLKLLRVLTPETLDVGERVLRCRIGRAGIAAVGEKREGDLKTPSGSFALRCVYYRPDRMEAPKTSLPVIALTPEDGWCDDSAHPLYNRPVKLPFAGRHEKLWREDHVYDLIIPLGYNDGADEAGNPTPIIPGAGSAIFMHLMRADGVGTEGCVALGLGDLLEVLENCDTDAVVEVKL